MEGDEAGYKHSMHNIIHFCEFYVTECIASWEDMYQNVNSSCLGWYGYC